MTVTCSGVKVCSTADALRLIHATRLHLLPACTQRPSASERADIRPGDVFIWSVTNADNDTGAPGLARWTEGRKWQASRFREGFLFYFEKTTDTPQTGRQPRTLCPPSSSRAALNSRRPPSPRIHSAADPNHLIKQTYSVICDPYSPNLTHWHLTTYFTQASVTQLHEVSSGFIPALVNLTFPSEMYKSFREYKAELQQTVDRAVDVLPRRRGEKPRLGSTPRETLPSLTTIVPRHSPAPSSPSSSSSASVPSSPSSKSTSSVCGFTFRIPSPSSLVSVGLPSSHTTSFKHTMPLRPLAELENAHPPRQRCELDQRHLAAFDSPHPLATSHFMSSTAAPGASADSRCRRYDLDALDLDTVTPPSKRLRLR